MKGSIATNASSMQALDEQYRAISHNLANASTTGYKRRVTSFAQALQRQVAGGRPLETGDMVRPVTRTDFSQAAMNVTGRSLDMAIEGDGFFVIETNEGPLYTRNGSFMTDDEGRLTDAMGRTVAGEAGPLTIPRDVGVTDVHVTRDGHIHADGRDIGQLRLESFEDPSVLAPVGDSCFRAENDAATQPAEDAVVHQGATESSNVNTVEDLVGLITVSRMYEANLKSIASKSERMSRLLQVAMS